MLVLNTECVWINALIKNNFKNLSKLKILSDMVLISFWQNNTKQNRGWGGVLIDLH